jgi:hypothetical protein
MYRYYLVKDKDLPTGDDNYGIWHVIHLGSHGTKGKGWNILVLQDGSSEPHKKWKPFPKVVDHKTPVKNKIDHTLLSDLGLTGEESTFEISERLGEIFSPMYHP